MSIRVGVDTGGTFTDVVAFDGGQVRVAKVFSTPRNPARAVLDGLGAVAASRAVTSLTYGTTVATNALLERRGARVLLFTTRGFEDVIEIGRQARPDLYALEPRRPEPLVPWGDRIGVEERVTHDGDDLVPLSRSAVLAAVRLARRRRPEATAVCFLHSYRQPRHEKMLADALRDAGFSCTSSHEIGALHREYERFSTAVINAYVAPRLSNHVEEVAAQLGGAAFRVMQSNGGAIDAVTACREAVRTILSGPAAGVAGARAMGLSAGFDRIITFDMGGTSTDVCLVDGEIRRHADCSVGGLPINVPAVDVHTVGAGGGSIAGRDAGGALRVGPMSAGADPGPACYGRGDKPTVTDANLVLGRLGRGVLAGEMHLDRARAEKALAPLARSLRLSLTAAAAGIVAVANAAMGRAIRRVSVERGYDSRAFVLLAFGGAAGVHACELAQSLGIGLVVVPRFAGVLSAWGAAGAETLRDYAQTVQATRPSLVSLQRRAAAMARQARFDLRAERAGESEIRVEPYLTVRYAGQSFEIEVPLTKRYGPAFHAAHRRLYGHADEEREIEVVVVGLRASAVTPRPPALTLPRRRRRVSDAVRGKLWTGRTWATADTVERDRLQPGEVLRGPMVIAELTATTYVPPGWRARVDDLGHLVLRHAG